jgi:hypothetical protein
MHRAAAFAAAALVGLSLAPTARPEGTGGDCFSFHDGFEAEAPGTEPSSWTVRFNDGLTTREAAAANGVTVAVDDAVSFAGRQSARLADGSGGYSVTLYQDLHAAHPGLAAARFDFMARIDDAHDDALNVAFGGLGTNQSEAVGLVFWEGDLRLRIGAVSHASDLYIGTYTEFAWHRYRIDIDTVTDRVWVLQDGASLGGPWSITGPGISNMADIRHLLVTTKNASTGTAWVDEFLIEEVCPDTVPPTLTVTGLPETLWPPDHRMVTLAPTVDADDDQDPEVEVTLVVSSSEPDDGLGDGDTGNDFVVRSPADFDLRAERSGTGSGRAYTLSWTATDDAGNATTVSRTVVVPKSQGRK